MKLLLLSIATVVLAVSSFGQSKLNSKIGVVNSKENGGLCMAIQNSRLKPGQKVQVVLLDKPQSVVSATVSRKVKTACSDSGEDKTKSFYSLRRRGNKDTFVGIGVIGINVSVTKGVAGADVNGDGKKDRFRSCTSTEGAHLTVWSGKPLVGNRIWHSYYYVGYDTESNCNEKDYK